MSKLVICGGQAARAAALAGGSLLVVCGNATADATVGKQLATARCITCHSSNETFHAVVPLLEGQPKAAFIAQWRAFRERQRTAPVMVSLAMELGEQDVESLAEHYATLLPPATSPSSGSESGRTLAARLGCSDCHGPEMRGSDSGAARLAGQKARYIVWSLQLMRGGLRSHGAAPKPDPLLAQLSNEDIESLAAHFASLR